MKLERCWIGFNIYVVIVFIQQAKAFDLEQKRKFNLYKTTHTEIHYKKERMPRTLREK